MHVAAFLLAVLAAAAPAFGQTDSRPLSLADALARARAVSPATRAAAARLEAAQAGAGLAGRLLNPTSELRWENFASGVEGGFPLDVFATLSQPFELGGERAARKGSAHAAVDTARALLSGVAAGADLLVARHYLGALGARDAARTLAGQAGELGELVRILERRVAEGVAAEADLRKLEAERARVDLDRLRHDVAAARAVHALAALVGPGPPVTLDALQMPIAPLLPGDEGTIAAAALERRPDVAAARARVVSAREALHFEEGRRVPDLVVTGGWKRTSGLDTGVFAVNFPVPLFDRNQLGVTLARGQVAAAEQELAYVLAVAGGDVRASVAAARQLAAEAGRVRASLAAPAAVARAAARAAFETGAADLLRVVDAERVHTETELVLQALASEAVLASIEARIALAEPPLP